MTETADDLLPLTWTHAIHDVSARGLDIKRAADTSELEALTSALEVLSVDSFEAAYRVTAQSGQRYRLSGSFRANVSQACVVTLEPITSQIVEEFSVGFCPPENADKATDDEKSVLNEPDVEILTNSTLEIGRILYELLVAALDPYPRKADAEFTYRDPLLASAAPPSPFAALSKLKNDG